MGKLTNMRLLTELQDPSIKQELQDYYERLSIGISFASNRDEQFTYVLTDYDTFLDAKNKDFFEKNYNRTILFVPNDHPDEFSRILVNFKGYHVVKGDRDDFLHVLKRILPARLGGREYFVVQELEPGMDIHDHSFEDSSKTQDILTGIFSRLKLDGVFSDYGSILNFVANELVTNAMYNAPIDEQGNHKYKDYDRKIKISFPVEERPFIKVQETPSHVTMIIRDNFGSLSKEVLDRYIAKEEEMVKHSEGTGGAGLGLFLVMRYASRFMINVVPGVCTEIICSIKKVKRNKAFMMGSKAFHCFVWRE